MVAPFVYSGGGGAAPIDPAASARLGQATERGGRVQPRPWSYRLRVEHAGRVVSMNVRCTGRLRRQLIVVSAVITGICLLVSCADGSGHATSGLNTLDRQPVTTDMGGTASGSTDQSLPAPSVSTSSTHKLTIDPRTPRAPASGDTSTSIESTLADTSKCMHQNGNAIPFGVPFSPPSNYGSPTAITSDGHSYPIAKEYFADGRAGDGVLCRTTGNNTPPAVLAALNPTSSPLTYLHIEEPAGVRPWGAFGQDVGSVLLTVKSRYLTETVVFARPDGHVPTTAAEAKTGDIADGSEGWTIFNTPQVYPQGVSYFVRVTVFSLGGQQIELFEGTYSN